MCCRCEPCTPTVCVCCSLPRTRSLAAARARKTLHKLPNIVVQSVSPSRASCPDLHTLKGSLSVIPASRDEPVFEDSPPAERKGRGGVLPLTALLKRSTTASSRLFPPVTTISRGPPPRPVWPSVLGGAPSLQLFWSWIDIFSGFEFSASFFQIPPLVSVSVLARCSAPVTRPAVLHRSLFYSDLSERLPSGLPTFWNAALPEGAFSGNETE